MTNSNEKNNCITVVMCEPNKLARIETIGTDLKDLQKAVDGYIEVIYPFSEEVCIVCNEEGKLKNLPLNRALKYDHKIVDIIAGPFFICGCKGENLASLTDKQQKKYLDMENSYVIYKVK